MTFETTAAGNKNGSTRPKGTNCLSLHDRTSLPVFFVGQYTGKCGRLQYGIFNKNQRAAGGGLHVSAMTNKNANAGLGVLRAKWRRTFQPRVRMRRRRGFCSGGPSFSAKTEKIWPAERRMRLRKLHRASGAFELHLRRHPAPSGAKNPPPSRGFFYAQSYPHVDVDCLQIFCSQLRNRCFTKLPVDRFLFRAHWPVDK